MTISDLSRQKRNSFLLDNKKALRKIYQLWYEQIAEFLSKGDPIVEIGSSGVNCGIFQQKIIKTNILRISGIEIQLDGVTLPFKNSSISNLIMIHVLHHINNPLAFLREADRVLKPRGRLVIIEPAITPVSYRIYRYLHYESCDLENNRWLKGEGPLTMENIAIPAMIFDKWKTVSRILPPGLELRYRRNHTFLSYLLTGGYSFRSLAPRGVITTLYRIENKLSFVQKMLALMMTVVLEKS